MHQQKKENERSKDTLKRLLLLFLISCLGLSIFGTRYFLRETLDYSSTKQIKKAFEQLIQSEQQKQILADMYTVHKGVEEKTLYGFFFSEEEHETVVAQLEEKTKGAAIGLGGIPSAVLSYISEEDIDETLTHRKYVTREYRWAQEQSAFVLEKEVAELFDIRAYGSRDPLTIRDVAKDETSLRGITRVLQEAILEKHDNPEMILQDVLALPDITFEDEGIVLPHALQLRTDPKVFGFDTIDLEYSALFPAIDTLFLDSAFVEAHEIKKEKREKRVALTFDDGPNTQSTMKLLKLLEKEQIKATFFVLGQMVTAHPTVASKIVEQGHEIANHSYTHPDLTKLSSDIIHNEVKKTDEAIFRATGILPKTFRAPYGAATQEVIRTVGLPMIHWDVDSLDWHSSDPQAIANKVLEEVRPGSIVLMHDIHERSVEAAPEIIRGLREQGYEFVTITELLFDEQQPYYQYFSATINQKNE